MNTLSGETFSEMVISGYKAIKLQYQTINDLNVFPVPDGDTGTNMTATMNGGIIAMSKSDLSSISDVAHRLANGMLLGARGNSGVILSQFFAGVSEGLEGLESANAIQVASALRSGVNKAYSAVIKPVEGTILTVAREGCTYAMDHVEEVEDIEGLFAMLLKRMKKSLKGTPDLLPVLKEAGVIDSGGAGLVAIIDGFTRYLNGEEIEDAIFEGPQAPVQGDISNLFNADSVLEYGYCTEFIMQLLNSKDGPKNFVLQDMIDYYSTFGDSIVAIESDGIVKVHVHTKTPGKVIDYAQQFGEFVTFKMENMSIQHQEVLLKEIGREAGERKKAAIVAVAPSASIAKIFTDLGTSEIVQGGQTMNPSADDFVKAIKAANAESVIVFPNNGNVILTAKQAASMVEDCDVRVIETKSIVECYSALGMLDLNGQSIDENVEIIHEQIANMVSCEVSVAVRDSVNNGLTIKAGQFIGISKGAVKAVDNDVSECALELLKAIPDIEDRSVITVFDGVGAKEEARAKLREGIEGHFPLIDFIEIEGEQTIYPFIIAVE